jgi:4-hydroxy-tetrahydrodipicolinate synthase
MPVLKAFTGILPAMQVPLTDDRGIDQQELRRFANWLAEHPGVGGLVTNGHTGEIFGLSPAERAEVTRIVVNAMDGRLPVVSGVSAEGVAEGVEHARMVRDAGASGILVMPHHHWLRFGMRPEHVVEYFTALGEATDISLVVHVYPAWSKAGYSSELLAELATLPWVTTFKVGTRELSQYDRDIRAIRAADPNIAVLTCHDEYLLPTMVQGVDGALVGFASFIPELVTGLFQAVNDGDLTKAKEISDRIFPLKEVVYGSGEPSADAHARMKTAMVLAGRLASDVVRRPVESASGPTRERIAAAVSEAGLTGPLPN